MAMWHRVRPVLTGRLTVVVAALPGYRWSAAPPGVDGDLYPKRRTGDAMVALMAELGHAVSPSRGMIAAGGWSIGWGSTSPEG